MSTPQPPTKILLLGAGELGQAFLPHLLTLPHTTITLGIRTPSNYTSLTTTYPSLTLLPLDLSSPSSTLIPIFSTYSIIISCTGFGQTPASLLKLANEILEAGKLRKEGGKEGDGDGRLWFFPWQWGVDYDITGDGRGLMPLFGAQGAVRQLLRQKAAECNVKWTILSTGIFMSFLFERFWGIVAPPEEEEGKWKVRALGSWDHQVTVTDVGDIGKVLVRVVKGDVESVDRVLYVAGDTVSYARLAEIVEGVTGREVVKEEWSIGFLEKELEREPDDELRKYRLVFAREGVWWEMERTVNFRLGIPVGDVESYARRVL